MARPGCRSVAAGRTRAAVARGHGRPEPHRTPGPGGALARVASTRLGTAGLPRHGGVAGRDAVGQERELDAVGRRHRTRRPRGKRGRAPRRGPCLRSGRPRPAPRGRRRAPGPRRARPARSRRSRSRRRSVGTARATARGSSRSLTDPRQDAPRADPVRAPCRAAVARRGSPCCGSFLVPAVVLAASGIGTPEPFPRAYLDTTFATRGDVGTSTRRGCCGRCPALPRR